MIEKYMQLDSNGFSRVPVNEIAAGAGRSPEGDPNCCWNPPAGQAGKDNDYERRKAGKWIPPVDAGGPVLIGGFATPLSLFNTKTARRESLSMSKNKADYYK